MASYESWDLAWQRYQLEYVAAAYDTYYEETRSPQPLGLQAVGAMLVLASVVLASLHAYILQTGGIVIAPGAVGHLPTFELHNFHELQHMDPSRLLEIGLPGPSTSLLYMA